MGDSISDADKIRNKRLAKLGSQASPRPSSSSQNEAPSTTPSSVSAPPNTSSGQSSLVPRQSGSSAATGPQAGPSSSSKAGASKAIGTAQGAQKRTSTTQADSKAPNVKRRSPAAEESIEVWEDKTLANIFRVSLDEGKRQDHLGHRLEYIGGVRQELESENAPLRLNTGLLDQAILEAASAQKKQSPLDYLLSCWKRVSRQLKNSKNKGDPASKLEIIKEARRLCMSYCIFAATMPDMFGREPSLSSTLAPHLLVEQEDDRGLCHDFLLEITSRFEEDESAKEAMVVAGEDLSKQLAHITMNGNYKPYVLAMRNLVRYPAMVNAMTESPRFLPPDIPAATLEVDTLIGPFFQISPLQSDVTSNYFSSPKTRDRNYIANSQNAIRMSLQTHQTELLDITNHIIKTSKESRERMLDWFARCVNLNHKRRALQVDKKTVSSDGFMINVTVCLDQLCEPFMDATFSKLDRIDVEYLRRKPRVDITDETKLNADQTTSDAFWAKEADGQSNFISEVFFLTVAAHHYGSEAAGHTLGQLEKDLKHMEKQLAKLESDREQFVNTPRLGMFERALVRYKDEIDKGLSYKYAVQGVLLDEQTQTRSMQFMRYVIVWLLRLVSPSQEYPKKPLKLPLPRDQPEVFSCLPEYFLEDVVGNFKFIMRNMPRIITSTQSDELIMICITFLRSGEYIKNPYLKAGLVTIMFNGVWPIYGKAKGVLGDQLNSLPFATEHLLHALMKFYIEAEHTGAHTAFYDKFNIRYEIFQIIKCIWSNTVYRDNLSVEARVNLEFFVQFVNLLLNDVTYVLDESISALKKIHDLQHLLENSPGMEAQMRTEKQEALTEAENKAKSYMQLTNETVAMLKLFTDALADSFTKPEVVQRLADMLDYNLEALVGPKSNSLKVSNMQEYGFNPKTLLAEIIDVYLNLGTKDSFVLAVARDGRSYKPETFDKATNLLAKFVLKSPDEIKRWTELGERFKKAKELDDQAEEDMGEIPDDFLDPLMFTLMEDPVILPSSRNTIDRSTIRSHLLSDPNDPFNRVPLKIEDVVPDTELKARIEAFKAEKKGQRHAGGDAMDLS